MYRVCIIKATNKMIESQGGGDELQQHQVLKVITDAYNTKYEDDKPIRTLEELLVEFADETEAASEAYRQANLDTLTRNAINQGHAEADIEVKFVTEEEYQVLIEATRPIPTYEDLRRDEYPHIDELIVALWEDIVESRPEAKIALQEKREAVKLKYPKP